MAYLLGACSQLSLPLSCSSWQLPIASPLSIGCCAQFSHPCSQFAWLGIAQVFYMLLCPLWVLCVAPSCILKMLFHCSYPSPLVFILFPFYLLQWSLSLWRKDCVIIVLFRTWGFWNFILSVPWSVVGPSVNRTFSDEGWGMHWSEEKILERQDDVLTFIIIAYDHTEPFLLKKKLPGLISDATLILWLIL